MSSSKQEMAGKVNTVLGVVDADDIGITLTHEHILLDFTCEFIEPKEAGLHKLAHAPVSIENLSWLRHNVYNSLDNQRLDDEEVAIEEVMHFKKEGGGTIVECSCVGFGRDPLGLARISRVTGINIVMGAGYYVMFGEIPDYDKRSEEELAEEIIADIEVGVGNTGIRAGIIGQLGCNAPIEDRERKSLLAAARAHRYTGAAITGHSGFEMDSPMEYLKILDDAGVDMSRVLLSHNDLQLRPTSLLSKLAKTGCYLEFGLFGIPINFFPLYVGASPLSAEKMNMPCDRERIEQIIELIDEGYLKQILISQDVSSKAGLVRNGGDGYAHILRHIVPQMLVRGITREQIHTIMVENPKRLLQFARK